MQDDIPSPGRRRFLASGPMASCGVVLGGGALANPGVPAGDPANQPANVPAGLHHG